MSKTKDTKTIVFTDPKDGQRIVIKNVPTIKEYKKR